MKTNTVLIETYKGIDIYYNKQSGRLCFTYEDREYDRVNYFFEAQEIIDEPRWDKCNLEGYFIDGTFNDYIGLAKATKKDIKSGKPYWLIKGQYDFEYKNPDHWREINVFLKTTQRDLIYQEWVAQKQKIEAEKQTERQIIDRMKSK